MATLADQIKTFEEAGFSSQEIETWKKDKVNTLSQAGFSTQEIAKDLGYKEVDLTPIRSAWQSIINFTKDENEEIYSEIKQLESQNDDTPFLEKRKQELIGKAFEPSKYWERGWGAGIWDLHQSYVNGEEMPEFYTQLKCQKILAF